MPCEFVRRGRGRSRKSDAGRRPAKVVQHSGDVGRPPAGAIRHSGDVGRPPARAIEHSGDVGRPPARAIGHFGDVGRPPARVIEHSSDVGRPPAGEFLTIKPTCFQRFPSLSSVFHWHPRYSIDPWFRVSFRRLLPPKETASAGSRTGLLQSNYATSYLSKHHANHPCRR